MVTLDGSLVMGSHPEFMSAGLKAFRSMEELKNDISELYKRFPPGKGRAWVAVSEDGDFYASELLDKDFDTTILKTKARDIYSLSGDKLPNTHKYYPFMKKRLNISFHYDDWVTVTREYLLEKGIPLTMEEGPKVASLQLGSSLSKTAGKKRKFNDDSGIPPKPPMKFKTCMNTNCTKYSLLQHVPCATKKCSSCKAAWIK
tara:strand:+ start:6804 stop:7406 length:603 start_codon:yes stop_codon:yes gene_type:complete